MFQIQEFYKRKFSLLRDGLVVIIFSGSAAMEEGALLLVIV